MLARIAQRWVAAVGIAVLALSTSACVKRLAAKPPPQAVAPAVDTSAPPRDGHGRLVVDVVEGSTPVQRATMRPQEVTDAQGNVRYQFYESYELLCAETPCVVDVPPGNVLLGFPVVGQRGTIETELVNISADPSVYRRSLSVRHRTKKGKLFVLGIIGASVGSVAVITGGVLVPIGLDDDNGDLALAGGITAAAGAALTAFGIWALRREADLFRPGSSIHYPLGQ